GAIQVLTDHGGANWQDGRWQPIESRPGARAETPSSQAIGGNSEVLAAVHQLAKQASGRRAAAASNGLFEQVSADAAWNRLQVDDGLGRQWATSDVRGVCYDARGELWFATRAGVGHRNEQGWTFYEGRDGLPYNDFTCCAAAPDGSVWFGTHLGAVHFHNGQWSYRQGQAWLPHDDVRAIVVDQDNTAWFATAGGVGRIEFVPYTLSKKAELYEAEVERYIKRTPYGYTSEADLTRPGDRESRQLHDSDNDGLWTAMYGAGECFAYGTTGSETARRRAQQAFEALRFLQTVTQGGNHAPPRGYVARTIRSTADPDPNLGRLERDRESRENGDRMWKVYEPRWPKSADGKWYWKSDTSSDELDGHYFFYPLYYDLVAKTDEERAQVRAVVRDLTDHLIEHEFNLVDHDGQPTRWGVFSPESLNHDIRWSVERGLNSLSMLSYLAVAAHVTEDARYTEVAQRLIRDHAYHANVMEPKAQRGIGSGNQSDDEMAFMSFYGLIKYTADESLRNRYLAAFYRYWMLEQPECNPFFNFAYAAVGQDESHHDAFERHDLSPWEGWLDDSVATLIDFPLDRLNWAHQNSHRLDLVWLPRQHGSGSLELNRDKRGYRVDGKVLPVSERHFNHWNTDPWQLDYHGNGNVLASGTVFLLPYYMGRYHGFIVE
ncbi:MAG: hypothetical protein KDB23_28295, partial [Planctomycetales bacterium]|nr:hypothetical protein [Planctomycetales bacterium]